MPLKKKEVEKKKKKFDQLGNLKKVASLGTRTREIRDRINKRNGTI